MVSAAARAGAAAKEKMRMVEERRTSNLEIRRADKGTDRPLPVQSPVVKVPEGTFPEGIKSSV